MNDKPQHNKPLWIRPINGVNVLHDKNGPVQCPFRNPFPMPHQLTGRVEFQVPVCSEACPFFNRHVIKDAYSDKFIDAVYFDCVGCDKIVNKEGGENATF